MLFEISDILRVNVDYSIAFNVMKVHRFHIHSMFTKMEDFRSVANSERPPSIKILF